MSIIIVEGFDNTGKTTLAKNLAEVLGYNYVSGGGPEVGTKEGALERLLLNGPNKVQDRTFISEMVYGKIIRGKSGISDSECMELINFCKENQVKFVYAKRPFAKIMETIDDREQMDGVKEFAKEVIAYYDYWMLNKLPIYLGSPIMYDYEICTLDRMVFLLAYTNAIPASDAKPRKFEFHPGGPSLTDG